MKRRKRNKNRLVLILLMVLLLYTRGALSTDVTDQSSNTVKVERVIDGDTFMIEGGEKVRLILIDAPESVHPDESKNVPSGKTSSEFLKELIEGQNVRLEKDVSERDSFGRLLRYAYTEDGIFINEHMVELGHATIATYPPDTKYVDEIRAAQKKAMDMKIGIWED